MSIRMPWRLKVLAKLVLSRAQLPYAAWARYNLFKHGSMDRLDYARAVFETHYALAGFDSAKRETFICLELGPGDSLLSALLARHYGSRRTYLVDVGDYALGDVEFYRRAALELVGDSERRMKPESWQSIEGMLADCEAEYLTAGLDSLRGIPDGALDWCWSQAVLEHVRRPAFPATVRELRRVLKMGGVTTHRVDFQDHLGGALNSLRFSHDLWESEFFAGAGFYTNRLRYSEIIEAFTGAGFRLESSDASRWNVLPTPREKLNPAFVDITDDDLHVRWADLVFRAI